VKSPLLDPDARIVIAHRGNSAFAPENTIESLRQALELGADAVEFDVRVTRDGVPVLLHDPTLDRTTSGRGQLADVSLGEVRTLDASRGLRTWTGGKLSVPTLEETLDRFRETPMVIEVKEMAAAEPTVRLVHKLGLQGKVIVGSGETPVAERLYRSGLNAIASRMDALALLPLAVVGLYLPTPDYQVLSVTPTLGPLPIPSARLAAAARRMRVPMHVWTVNDAAQAVTLWGHGISGIITDRAAEMLVARTGMRWAGQAP